MSTKYQEMLNKRIEQTVMEWSAKHAVTEDECYRFFHGLKGTAGTIGLTALSDQAEKALAELEEDGTRILTGEEWRKFFAHDQIKAFTQEAATIEQLEEIQGELDDQPESVPFILMIEKDVEFIKRMKGFLEENAFQVITTMTLSKGLEHYYDLSPDLLIVDLDLLSEGEELLISEMMKKARKDLTPIILVSGELTDEKRIAAYEMGVLDVIGKPINENIIIPFLRNRIFQRNMLLGQIRNDFLTGALKRDCLEHEVLQVTKKMLEGETGSAVFAMVDLDHFKQVNDTYGHPAGDEVLRTFAKIILETKDPADRLIRFGGEEFSVVFPESTYEEAEKKIQNWREAFNQHVFSSGEQEFNVQFSAGLNEWHGAVHIKEILECADKSLYYAKENGRNCTVRYSEVIKLQLATEQMVLIVVDDDELVREMLKDHFERRGKVGGRSVDVKTYANGVDFLQGDWYTAGKKYMILLDGMMPKMDGIEVLAKLREAYGTRNILVSMLTARQGDQEVERALGLGADDYMVKPFNVREVASRIDRMMERMFS
ncbi:GGDEF domain-containing response regulator [Jeotgalibacillus haloalkalitolerans]|uniref:Diguanylate cyclase n=1 Tax=Jeotgalibacillus haloalkalitolerans TaxID=3104292 RepID=A0ABU5KI05_9BACL|nr:diguanylate cyclase [Jeotgalibacillus sp. HH7-29]MDZ5710858.1 diguanylate cyclase [Jeotgalibacillus sp. HH7-29]